MLPLTLIATAAVAVLLVAEASAWKVVVGLAKGIASSAFIAVALGLGATATPYGRALLIALALSWLGDLLLLSRERRPFLAGLAAFLGAHLAFAVAFLLAGVDWGATALAMAPLVGVALLVARWLLPHVGAAMRMPVIAYTVALTCMVALAAGAAFYDRGGAGAGRLLVLGAAAAFLLSDLSVARDRFVSPGLANKLWGWPLYYAAQLTFAATVGAAALGAVATG